MAIFGLGLVVAIGAAVWLADPSALRLEDPAESEISPVETFAIGVQGPVEVSGIRPYYDDEYQAHVRAFVANHSRDPVSVAVHARLRVRAASPESPPLATFEIVVPNPIPGNEGTEIDVPLQAMGSLASFPPWEEMRVDLEPMGAAAN